MRVLHTASRSPEFRLFRATHVAVACACFLVLSACGSASGGSVPIDTFVDEPEPSAGQYIIAVGDALGIDVFEQEKMSTKARVRSDGRITVPLLNEVVAAGKTPTELATELETKLKALILTPRVTVVVEESSPMRISVLGEVATQGVQELHNGSGVAAAIAAAGGLSTFAHRDRIFVVRANPKPVRIHFTWDQITGGAGRAAAFKLRPGDVIVVE